MKLINLLLPNAEKCPQITAAIDKNTSVTYQSLYEEANRLSDMLYRLGCRSGVKVGIFLENSVEYLVAFFAISKANSTIAPCSNSMTAYEVISYIKKADISIIITTFSFAEKLADFKNELADITVICVEYKNQNYSYKILNSGNTKVDMQNTDVALIVSTSGSTGPSKIVMLTDQQLISNMNSYKSVIGLNGHRNVYIVLKLNHIYCICAQLLTHISRGDSLIIKSGPFFIKDFFSTVEKHGINITAMVPYMGTLMVEFPAIQKFNAKSLETITLSGSKTSKTVYQKLIEKYPDIDFINTYGMSEAGSRISICMPKPKSFPPDSVGKALPSVRLRITDDNKNSVKTNTIGHIEIKGSGVMKGYYKMPLETNKTIEDGWLKTGDLGRLDENGNLFLEGRKKQIIISGGENINPFEIEQHLLEHPHILEAAVIGSPDIKMGEIPCAYIVVNDNQQINNNELINFCRSKLSNHKIPRKFYQISEMPKLSSSKINKTKLQEYSSQNLQANL